MSALGRYLTPFATVILEPDIDENGRAGIFEVEFSIQVGVARLDIGIEISPACTYATRFHGFQVTSASSSRIEPSIESNSIANPMAVSLTPHVSENA